MLTGYSRGVSSGRRRVSPGSITGWRRKTKGRREEGAGKQTGEMEEGKGRKEKDKELRKERAGRIHTYLFLFFDNSGFHVANKDDFR